MDFHRKPAGAYGPGSGALRTLPLFVLLVGGSVDAAEDASLHLDLPAQPLSATLDSLAQTSRVKLVYADAAVKGLEAPPLHGRYTVQQALDQVLGQNGLRSEKVDKTLIAVKGRDATSPNTLPKVTVTGKAQYDANDPYNKDYAVRNAFTATKTDTPRMETPVSIEVITRAVMDDQQAISLQDAVKNVAGVQPGFSAGTTYNIFTLRGFTTAPGDTTESASVYREGMRLTGFPFPTANLQRVEVLKGPAAVLYGRMEPGGMINAVPKDALATPYYSLQQQFGSYDLYRTSADATGPVTTDGSLLYRLNFEYLDSGSFRKGPKDLFNRQLDITPNLTWNIDERTTLELEFEYRHQENIWDWGVPAIGVRPANIPISRYLGDVTNEYNNRDDYLVDVDLSHRFNDDWQLQWKGTYAHTDRQSTNIYGFGLDDAGLLNRFYVNYNDDRNYYFTALNLNGKFNTFGIKNNFLGGFDYYKQSVNTLIGDSGEATPINIYNPVYGTTRRTYIGDGSPIFPFHILNDWYGIYLQDQIDVTEQLHLLLGGRFDHAESLAGDKGTPAASKLVKTDKLNPRYGLVYQPWKWLSLYGHYVESIGTNNGRPENGQAFEPETSQEYEGGIKTEFFDGRFTGTLAYYDLTKQNVLTTDPLHPTFSLAIGEARSRGIELDVSGRVTEGLSVITTYAYTDARITQDNDGNEGHRLPNAPEHAGSVWAKYAFQQAALTGLSVGAGVYLASQREGDNANSYQLPGYARLDAMAGYAMKIGDTKLTTQLNINNLLDKQYYAASRGNRYWISPGEPLTVMGSVRLEY